MLDSSVSSLSLAYSSMTLANATPNGVNPALWKQKSYLEALPSETLQLIFTILSNQYQIESQDQETQLQWTNEPQDEEEQLHWSDESQDQEIELQKVLDLSERESKQLKELVRLRAVCQRILFCINTVIDQLGTKVSHAYLFFRAVTDTSPNPASSERPNLNKRLASSDAQTQQSAERELEAFIKAHYMGNRFSHQYLMLRGVFWALMKNCGTIAKVLYEQYVDINDAYDLNENADWLFTTDELLNFIDYEKHSSIQLITFLRTAQAAFGINDEIVYTVAYEAATQGYPEVAAAIREGVAQLDDDLA